MKENSFKNKETELYGTRQMLECQYVLFKKKYFISTSSIEKIYFK